MVLRGITLWTIVGAMGSCALAQTASSPMAPTGSAGSERQAVIAQFGCGPACMAFAFRILGVPFTNEDVSSVGGEGPTSFAELQRLAESKGVRAMAVRIDPGVLPSLRHVAILQVLVPVGAERMEHFVVFAGPAPEEDHGQMVYLFDPIGYNGLRGAFPVEELAEFFTGRALVLSTHPIELASWAPPLPARGRGTLARNLAILGCAGIVALAAARRVLRMRHLSRVPGLLALGMLVLPWTNVAAEAGAPRGAGPTSQSVQLVESLFVVGSLVHQAGDVSAGETVTHEFRLRNPTGEAVQVRLGKQTCACLDAQYLGPETLQPGAEALVRLQVAFAGGGPQTQGVFVAISTLRELLFLCITGTAKDDTRIQPAQLDFAEVLERGPAQQRPFRVTHQVFADSAFSVAEISADKPQLRVIEAGSRTLSLLDNVTEHQRDFVAVLDPGDLPAGATNARITVVLKSGAKTLRFEIPVNIEIVPPVRVRPEQIVRIQKQIPEELEVTLRLEPRSGGARRVGSVDAEGAAVAGWTQQVADDATILTLRLRPALTDGRGVGRCIIRLEGDDEPIVVPIRLIQITSP
jgi:hypothetical protein